MTVRRPRSAPRRPPRLGRFGRPLAAATVLALIGLYLVEPDGRAHDVTYLVVTFGAAVLAWMGSRGHSGTARHAWRWIAVGIGASATGDLVSTVYQWQRGAVPDTSVADVFWLASYVAVVIGLFRLLASQRDGSDREGALDMGAVGVLALLVVWQFSVQAIVTDASTAGWIRAVWAAYPILDAVLLAVVVRTVVARRAGWTAGAALVGGAACWLVSDFVYVFIAANASYEGWSQWLDVGWMLGAALLAAASWTRGRTSAAPRKARSPGLSRIALSVVPLLTPAAIEVWTFLRGKDTNAIPLFLAMAALVGITYVRVVGLMRAAAQAHALVQSSERHFRALAANSADAVVVVDAAGLIIEDSPSTAVLVGDAAPARRGANLLDLVLKVDAAGARAMVERALAEPGEVIEDELRVRHADGTELWLSVRVVNMTGDPDVAGLVVNLQDITARKNVEEELAHRAFHDSLTGLANRALFHNRVQHAIDRAARSGSDPAVIYLDLDGFKRVNDSLGHSAGDILLREVSNRLRDAVRPGDTVGRLGGDEFAVLIEESARPTADAEVVAERIIRMIATPIDVGSGEVTVSASIGIATGDADRSCTALLRNADIAMYKAKAAGKSRVVLFEPEMRIEAVERVRLETDLGNALERDELFLVYQPVVDLQTSGIVGFEALLRWQHPSLGLIGPDRFIPIAEETGLIVPIGAWVLAEACRTGARWQRRAGAPRLNMSVNVSGRQLASSELVDHVAEALRRSGLDAGSLVLEITETSLVQDPATAAARLRNLRTLGVRLAVDDFGTGYSSLSYLRQFPVDILKIDRSFINTISEPDQVPAIIRALLDLSRTLGLETVAEGIELELQRDQLRDEQCELGQGFLFAKPLTADEAEALLGGVDTTLPAV